jgi:hypothetical protein
MNATMSSGDSLIIVGPMTNPAAVALGQQIAGLFHQSG